MPRAGYYSLAGIALPTGGEAEYFVSIAYVDHLRQYGPDARLWELGSVEQTIREPAMVFQGLRRDGKRDALCFVGKPKRFGQDWTAPGPPGMVFLIFLTADRVIYEWRWEKEDSSDPGYPGDYKRRFEKRIWPQS